MISKPVPKKDDKFVCFQIAIEGTDLKDDDSYIVFELYTEFAPLVRFPYISPPQFPDWLSSNFASLARSGQYDGVEVCDSLPRNKKLTESILVLYSPRGLRHRWAGLLFPIQNREIWPHFLTSGSTRNSSNRNWERGIVHVARGLTTCTLCTIGEVQVIKDYNPVKTVKIVKAFAGSDIKEVIPPVV